MCDLNMRNEKELDIYNIELSTRLKNYLSKDIYSRTSENTPVISPQRSGQCIAAILRYSVLTVEDKKGLNKKKKAEIARRSLKRQGKTKTATQCKADNCNHISPSMILYFDWPFLGASGSNVAHGSIARISNS
jgi:hypothetical protein